MFEPWEDLRLTELVKTHGTTNWQIIAMRLPGRSPRQCRERWSNYVNPNLSKHEWTETEDEILLTTYRDIGPKWFVIANFLPGRSRNSTKNRYFALQRNPTFSIRNQSEFPLASMLPTQSDFSAVSAIHILPNPPIQQMIEFQPVQTLEQHRSLIVTEQSKQNVNHTQVPLQSHKQVDDVWQMDWDIDCLQDPFLDYL
jgi:hypothetical protein